MIRLGLRTMAVRGADFRGGLTAHAVVRTGLGPTLLGPTLLRPAHFGDRVATRGGLRPAQIEMSRFFPGANLPRLNRPDLMMRYRHEALTAQALDHKAAALEVVAIAGDAASVIKRGPIPGDEGRAIVMIPEVIIADENKGVGGHAEIDVHGQAAI